MAECYRLRAETWLVRKPQGTMGGWAVRAPGWENDVGSTANVLSICAGVGGIDLGLDIPSPGRAARSVTWERKPMRSDYWSNAWRKKGWLRRLSE